MSKGAESNQWISSQHYALSIPLLDQIEAFIVDRQSAGLRPGSIYFYQKKLGLLVDFCRGRDVTLMGEITPDLLRGYLLQLQAAGHNPGGQHAAYRALRAFFKWFELEHEPEAWRNPIGRVKAPRVDQELLEPVPLDDIAAMLKNCGSDALGKRDRALVLFLLDTGTRAAECLALNVDDYEPNTGRVHVRRGKGGKGRVVFVGRRTRRAIRQYLGARADGGPLWVNAHGDRLKYAGLRQIMRRRANGAGVPVPALHAFRRAFALNCLRGGMDVRTLQRLMGHSSLAVLTRYLKMTDEDLRAAHSASSPADAMDL